MVKKGIAKSSYDIVCLRQIIKTEILDVNNYSNSLIKKYFNKIKFPRIKPNQNNPNTMIFICFIPGLSDHLLLLLLSVFFKRKQFSDKIPEHSLQKL